MKVRIYRQCVSQIYESETEITEWLEQVEVTIDVKLMEYSAYLTDNTLEGQPGYIFSIW